ncbi:MAG: DUF4174 domain-containing protein [Fodinibius sp.]|nr:DUF4174 domain-containing protein [Fodinibius sp.]
MLKHIICLFVLINITTVTMAQSTMTKILEQYKWEYRLLLVFADTDSSNYYENQINELDGNEDGLQS